ncbi:MAG: hypothetical protein WBE13_12955 [Candidatus Acidiferrum sp.]
MLDLCITRLKAIAYPKLGWISARFFDDAFKYSKFEANHQSGIRGFEFPDAAEIRRDDLEITVNSGSAISFVSAATINADGRSDVNRNHNLAGATEFDDSWLIRDKAEADAVSYANDFAW